MPLALPIPETMLAAYYWLQARGIARSELTPRLVAAGEAALKAPLPDGFAPFAQAAAEAGKTDPADTAIALLATWDDAKEAAQRFHANQNTPPANENYRAKNSHQPAPDHPSVRAWSERADLK